MSLEPATTADLAYTAPSLDDVLEDLGAVVQQAPLATHGRNMARKKITESRTVDYTSAEVYIDVRQTLWTADQSPDGRIAPGQYSFPFR